MSIPVAACACCNATIKRENDNSKTFTADRKDYKLLCAKCKQELVEMFERFKENAERFLEKFKNFLKEMSEKTKIAVDILYSIAERSYVPKNRLVYSA